MRGGCKIDEAEERSVHKPLYSPRDTIVYFVAHQEDSGLPSLVFGEDVIISGFGLVVSPQRMVCCKLSLLGIGDIKVIYSPVPSS